MVYSAAVMRHRKIPLSFDSNDVQIVQIVGNFHAVGEQKNQVGPKARSEKKLFRLFGLLEIIFA